MRTVQTESAGETHALGEALGRLCGPGTVIALSGPLGAGKTVLAKGIGAGLGVTSRVQSPTFVIVQAHAGGRLPFWHVDLYRLADESELDQLGLDELIDGGGVAVVEWAERFGDALPADRLEVALVGDGEARTITLRATGPRHAPLVGAAP